MGTGLPTWISGKESTCEYQLTGKRSVIGNRRSWKNTDKK